MTLQPVSLVSYAALQQLRHMQAPALCRICVSVLQYVVHFLCVMSLMQFTECLHPSLSLSKFGPLTFKGWD